MWVVFDFGLVPHLTNADTPAFHHFIPDCKSCIDPACLQTPDGATFLLQDRPLVESITIDITVFTQDFGPVPGLTTSKYCRSKQFS